MSDTAYADQKAKAEYKIWNVILASAAGTVIEWYDFYIFGTLATTLAPRFYPPGDETVQLLLYLSTFAVGFVVRPFGAIFFGRIGDLVGRKYAFLVTLLIMGSTTAGVGLLPSYGTIGYAAPILLIVFRILQGLALGGEYGGAAIYVAEHVPDSKRGFYTSFIQITASLGLFLALIVVIVCQRIIDPADFKSWGWRIPFLISLLLVGLSLYIRLKMKESPIFSSLKASGKTSTKPLTDALKGWDQLEADPHHTLRRHRRPGCRLVHRPVLRPVLPDHHPEAGDRTGPVGDRRRPRARDAAVHVLRGAVRQDRPEEDHHGRLPARGRALPPDLPRDGLGGRNRRGEAGVDEDPVTGEPKLSAINAEGKTITAKTDASHKQLMASGKGALPLKKPNYPLLVFYIFIQMIFVCMVYGPMAAYLVEAFPAKIRYTSMSLPYHMGNGIFGGLLPLIGLYVNSATKNIYAGLYYPIVVAAITFVVGSLLLKETHDERIWDEMETARADDSTSSA